MFGLTTKDFERVNKLHAAGLRVSDARIIGLTVEQIDTLTVDELIEKAKEK